MTKKKQWGVTAKVWLWPGSTTSWHFVSIDKVQSAEIKDLYGTGMPRRGFGSIRVTVTLGESEWATSIFPSKQSQMYLLPIKAKIRKAEQIYEGDEVELTLTV